MNLLLFLCRRHARPRTRTAMPGLQPAGSLPDRDPVGCCLSPRRERGPGRRGYSAVFAAVVTVFVVLVARRSAVIAIVQYRRGRCAPDANAEQHTKGAPASSAALAEPAQG